MGTGARGCGGLWRVGTGCGKKVGNVAKTHRLRAPATCPARVPTRSPTPRRVIHVLGYAAMQGEELGTHHGNQGERWRVKEVGRLQKWWGVLSVSVGRVWGVPPAPFPCPFSPSPSSANVSTRCGGRFIAWTRRGRGGRVEIQNPPPFSSRALGHFSG